MRTTSTAYVFLIAAALASSASAELITDIVAFAAADGSALGGPIVTDTASHAVSYPLGLTKRDKKGVVVFANKMPPGISSNAHLLACDGKLSVFYDWGTTRLSAYTMGKPGFTLAGARDHKMYRPYMDDSYTRPLMSSEIVVGCLEYLTPKGQGGTAAKISRVFSVTAYDRKLSKLIWKTPNANEDVVDDVRWLGNDVVMYATQTNVTFYKRGKLFAAHTIPATCGYVPGQDGRLVYYDNLAPGSAPISYCSKKEVVFTDVALTEVTRDWLSIGNLNSDMLYVYDIPGPQTNIVYAYKLGPSIQFVGSLTTIRAFFYPPGFDGTTVHVFWHDWIDSTWYAHVVVYSGDLKKQLWSSASSPGKITFLAKGVYCRTLDTDLSRSLQVFGKNGVIATHVFTKL